MRRSGAGLLIGFNRYRKATQMNENTNLRIDFYEAMRRFHGEGLDSLLCFWIDTRTRTCSSRPQLCNEMSYDFCVQLRVLTPYPEDPVQASIMAKAVLFVRDGGSWISSGHTPFPAKGMTRTEL